MGPKKQAAKQGDDEDLSTKELLSQYKRFSKDLEIQMFKPLETKLTEIIEEGGKHLNEILINEKIGEFGARALFNALKAVK